MTRRTRGFDSLTAYQMIESYDGLCGIIADFASSSLQIRCHYEFGHSGSCSFTKYSRRFRYNFGYASLVRGLNMDEYEYGCSQPGHRHAFVFGEW